jgi:hypothetical protein
VTNDVSGAALELPIVQPATLTIADHAALETAGNALERLAAATK